MNIVSVCLESLGVLFNAAILWLTYCIYVEARIRRR